MCNDLRVVKGHMLCDHFVINLIVKTNTPGDECNRFMQPNEHLFFQKKIVFYPQTFHNWA